MATLDLPDDPRTLVWRLIVARLQADPALDGAVRTWLVWDGSRASAGDLATAAGQAGVALRLYPMAGSMSWFDAQAMRAPLVIVVESSIPGLDAEDMLNLQGAIEDALIPPGDEGSAWQQQLVAAGALTGLFAFNQPLAQSPPTAGTAGGFRPMGTFSIDVMKTLIH
jgi:hypothetical protein